jgi:hypothetical protein
MQFFYFQKPLPLCCHFGKNVKLGEGIFLKKIFEKKNQFPKKKSGKWENFFTDYFLKKFPPKRPLKKRH